MGTYVLQDEKKHPDRRRRGERQNSFVPSSSPDSADFGTKAISSARDQAGFFAKGGGFDIYVEKNTDLKGGLIASKASPDKNKLSTGTLSYNDLKNEADYSAKSIGATYHKYGNYKNMTEDEQTKFTTPSVLHRASPYLSREMEAVRQNLSLLQEPSTSARIRHRTSLPSAVILQTRSTNSVKSSKKRGLNLKLLDNVVEALGQGHKLDAKYRDHTLHGNEKIPPVVK